MESGEISLQGFDELARCLDELPDRIGKKLLKDGVVEGAKVIAFFAEKNLHLAHPCIGIEVKRTGSLNAPKVWIGPLKRRWYLIFREFGTKEYDISAGTNKKKSSGKKVLAETGSISAGLAEFKGIRGYFEGVRTFGTKAKIPPRPAKPFLRPAFDMAREMAIYAMGNFLGPRIAEEAKTFFTSTPRSRKVGYRMFAQLD
jgi:hypothetical protein